MHRSSRWPRVASWAVLLGTLLVLLASAPAVDAHAVFESASPAPEARLASAPTSLRIVFSEPLNGPLSGITLLSGSGAAVHPESARVDPTDRRAYVLQLPPLSPARYTVAWHTVSLVDGHARTGSYTFTVLEPDGSAPPAPTAVPVPPPPPTVPQLVLALGAWFLLGGLVLAAGPILLGILAPLPDRDVAAAARRLGRLLLAGAGAGLLGTLVGLLAAAISAGGPGSLAGVAASPFGFWSLVRGIAFGLLMASALVGRRRARRGLALGQGGLLALATLATAATSHGAASTAPTWGLLLDLGHLAGSAAWVGIVVALAICYLDLPAGHAAADSYRGRLLRTVSLVAGVGVPLTLLTGLGSAVLELAAPTDLLSTGYGQALLVKLGAGAVLLMAAGVNALWLREAARRSLLHGERLRRVAAIEGVMGLVVVGLAAVMSVGVPARATDAARQAVAQVAADSDPASSFSGQTTLAGTSASLTITPGTLGPNVLRLELGRDLGATLSVTAADPSGHVVGITLDRSGPEAGGTAIVYAGSADLTGPSGTWRIALSIPGQPSDGAPLLAPLQPTAGPGAPVQGSSGPPQPWLALIAVATLGAVALASARGVAGARPRRMMAGAGALTVAVAVGGAGLLAGGLTRPPTSWGASTLIPPRDTGVATVWPVPSPNAGLMMPVIDAQGRIWVPEMNVNKLAALDPQNRTLREFTFPSPIRSTMGAAVDRSGRIWLAQEAADALGRFDPTTGDYREFHLPTPAGAPTGIAIAPNGLIWFTELGGDKVGSFDPQTQAFEEYPLGQGDLPFWIALSPDGRVWATDLQGDHIAVVDPAHGTEQDIAVPGKGTPTGIAVGNGGTVWFSVSEGSLVRLDPTTLAMHVYPLPMGIDYGVAIAADGRIWVGSATDTVAAVDPSTGKATTYRFAADSGPWWPVIAPDGSVWVALSNQQGNALARILPAASTTAASPGPSR
jgi:virginiamycin B lyase